MHGPIEKPDGAVVLNHELIVTQLEMSVLAWLYSNTGSWNIFNQVGDPAVWAAGHLSIPTQSQID